MPPEKTLKISEMREQRENLKCIRDELQDIADAFSCAKTGNENEDCRAQFIGNHISELRHDLLAVIDAIDAPGACDCREIIRKAIPRQTK